MSSTDPLQRLFDYIDSTHTPNISVYGVSKTNIVKLNYNTLIFKPNYVLRYAWFYRIRNSYYTLIELTNLKYMYVKGIIGKNTKFKFYIGSDKQSVINCMKDYVHEWYLEDTTHI